MDILNLLRQKRECKHTKVSQQEDFAYCPDCGELIENRWYIARCKCCGIKVKAIYKGGKVISQEKFCHNCGGQNFEPEQVSNINCIDINYAVLVKTVVTQETEETTQSWFEMPTGNTTKLLTQT